MTHRSSHSVIAVIIHLPYFLYKCWTLRNPHFEFILHNHNCNLTHIINLHYQTTFKIMSYGQDNNITEFGPGQGQDQFSSNDNSAPGGYGQDSSNTGWDYLLPFILTHVADRISQDQTRTARRPPLVEPVTVKIPTPPLVAMAKPNPLIGPTAPQTKVLRVLPMDRAVIPRSRMSMGATRSPGWVID